jgi:hypothetical protein
VPAQHPVTTPRRDRPPRSAVAVVIAIDLADTVAVAAGASGGIGAGLGDRLAEACSGLATVPTWRHGSREAMWWSTAESWQDQRGED